MTVFYINNFGKNSTISFQDCSHLWSMRPNPGELIKITDLKGNLFSIKILSVDKKTKRADFKIISKNISSPKKIKKNLYQAIIDKPYLDKLMEVAAICQIDNIYLFYSKNSLKVNPNLDRLNKILIRSCEQSENLYLPKITILQDGLNFVSNLESGILMSFLGDNLSNAKIQGTEQNIIVGPEGGFTKIETETVLKNKRIQQINFSDIIYPAWVAGSLAFEKIYKNT